MELGIGMVGTGYMARRHCEALEAHPSARLQVICSTDRSESAAAEMRDQFGFARSTASLIDAMDDPLVDVVFVCSPDAAHPEQVAQALDRQKHVFCEKPLARSHDDFAAIEHLLAGDHLVLQVGMNCRFRAANRELERLARQRVLGELRYLRGTYVQNAVSTVRTAAKPWVLDVPADANQFLHGGGLHCLDLMRWIAGPIASVFARASGLELGDVWRQDTFSASIGFVSGVPGELLVSASAFRPNAFTLEAWFENGSVVDGIVHARDGDAIGRSSPLAAEQEKPDLVLQFEDLVGAIAESRPPLNSFEEAFENFRVLDAAERSAETGEPVVLAPAPVR